MEHFIGAFSLSPEFFLALLSIVLIDIVLAGDNSVVIAMAVRSLPQDKRFQGILFGAGAAVLLRVVFTFFAAKMLLIPLVKFIGGGLIFWIAIKLMVDDSKDDLEDKKAETIWRAVWIILVADFTMSLDNILAVAGASHGNLLLLLFGLGLSIPLVVFTSTLISKLMDRFAIIVWAGAAILGKVGGEMMISDPLICRFLLEPLHLTALHESVVHPQKWLDWSVEIAGVAFVILGSMLLRRRKHPNT